MPSGPYRPRLRLPTSGAGPPVVARGSGVGCRSWCRPEFLDRGFSPARWAPWGSCSHSARPIPERWSCGGGRTIVHVPWTREGVMPTARLPDESNRHSARHGMRALQWSTVGAHSLSEPRSRRLRRTTPTAILNHYDGSPSGPQALDHLPTHLSNTPTGPLRCGAGRVGASDRVGTRLALATPQVRRALATRPPQGPA